jgi:hypothetical protein
MKLLRETAEPRVTQSSTESDEPSRDIPYTERALPSRMKLRKERDDPNITKSNTEIEDPSLVIP